MTITVNFCCDGCGAIQAGTSYLKSHFESITPEGWIAFDPYTRCTYCPKCWDEIEGHRPDERGTDHD